MSGTTASASSPERILEATIATVSQYGFGRFPLATMLERAELGRSTFYEHFRDSRECFLVALEAAAETLEARAEAAIEKSSERAAAEAAIEAIVGFGIEEEAAAKVLFIESLAAGPAAQELRDGLCDRISETIEEAWSSARGEARPDIRAAMVVGGVFRLMAMRLRHGPGSLGGSLASELAEWVEAYRAVTPASRALAARVVSEERIGSGGGGEARRLPRGRHRLSPSEVAEDQRRRILMAVAELSHELGYEKVSVATITKAAGVSRNVFYAQFRNREEAASEAHELFFQEAMTRCAGAFFSATDWAERVWKAGEALLELLAAEPVRAELSFVEPHAIGRGAVQHTYERLMAFTLFLEEGYRQRAEAGQLARVSSEALAAMMFEVSYRELQAPGGAAMLPQRLPELVCAVLGPFLGVDAARVFVEQRVAAGSH